MKEIKTQWLRTPMNNLTKHVNEENKTWQY